jgi:hypothetical protein
MKPVTAICTLMLVAAPSAGFAQDRSYPDFGSIGKTAGPASGSPPAASNSAPALQPSRAMDAKIRPLSKQRTGTP